MSRERVCLLSLNMSVTSRVCVSVWDLKCPFCCSFEVSPFFALRNLITQSQYPGIVCHGDKEGIIAQVVFDEWL